MAGKITPMALNLIGTNTQFLAQQYWKGGGKERLQTPRTAAEIKEAIRRRRERAIGAEEPTETKEEHLRRAKAHIEEAEQHFATALDRIRAELMELLPKAANRADAPENARIGELFKTARDLVYASDGPPPTNERRLKLWRAKRDKVWDEFCGGRAGEWRRPAGMRMHVSPRIAAGYIKGVR